MLLSDSENSQPGAVVNHWTMRNAVEHVVANYNMYPWILLSQAVVAMIPRFLWLQYEAGKVKNLIQELKNPALDRQKQIEQRNRVTRFFINTNRKFNDRYFHAYLCCEILNHIITICQFFVIGSYLDTNTYGLSYYGWVNDDLLAGAVAINNVADIIFPAMVKCRVPVASVAGFGGPTEVLCSLPINRFYANSYVGVW